jgi:hypothetical protein
MSLIGVAVTVAWIVVDIHYLGVGDAFGWILLPIVALSFVGAVGGVVWRYHYGPPRESWLDEWESRLEKWTGH